MPSESSSGGIGVEVIVSGVNEFDAAIEGLKERMRLAARNIVEKGALIVADSAKEQYRSRPAGSMRISHITGRKYYSGAPPYQAVPPNPTIRTGNTRNSIRPRSLSPVGTDGWMSTTGASTNYERFPELGTRFIKVPFPAIKMGLKNAEDRLLTLAESEWAEAEGLA
jgi:hypothetical protein